MVLFPLMLNRTATKAIQFSLFLILALTLLFTVSNAEDFVTIQEVIDGDTVRVNYKGRVEKVRLIGIDAPESRSNPRAKKQAERSGEDLRTIFGMGKEATSFVKTLVKPGDRARLEFDVERRDRYKRLLAYVWLSNGRMLNEEVVRAGYASLLTYPPNVRYEERFQKAYREARENRRGLWK